MADPIEPLTLARTQLDTARSVLALEVGAYLEDQRLGTLARMARAYERERAATRAWESAHLAWMESLAATHATRPA